MLSDAVARDFATIRAYDRKDVTPNMFEDDVNCSAEAKEYEQVKELIRPIVEASPGLTGEAIILEALKRKIGVDLIFGRYLGKDFTRMRNDILGKGARYAKTIEH